MRWFAFLLCVLAGGCTPIIISGPAGRTRIVDAETGAPVGKAAIAALIVARVKCSQFHWEGEECGQTFQKIDLRTDDEGYVTIPAWGPLDVGTLANPDALNPVIYVYVPGNVYMAGFASSRCRGRCANTRPDQAWFADQDLTVLKLKPPSYQFLGLGLVSGPGHEKCEWLELANWAAAVQVDREREYLARTIKVLEERRGGHWSAQSRAANAEDLHALRAGNMTYEQRFGSAKLPYNFDPTACPDGLR